MMLSQAVGRRRRRIANLLCSMLVFLCIVIIYSGSSAHFGGKHAKREFNDDFHVTPFLKEQARFWRSIYQIILNHKPGVQVKPEVVVPTNLRIVYQDDHVHNRPDIMWMNDIEVQRMTIAHANFLKEVKREKVQLVFNHGTRGIITTVSDTGLPVLLVSLRMLRSTGSSLPVEVFLWHPSPHTNHLCSTTLPRLNAKCVFFAHVFRAADTGVDLKSYQYKIFAILFSSFDEVLFLDSDAWAATNPDYLFTTQPFTNTGMVIWPDFWYASESPYFFKIANVTKIPELRERAASEAGILMYAKNRHGPSILLATYYNYYGPDYYYPLQSQGGPGQGDKETFGLAALVMDEPFYAVKSPVTALGRRDSSSTWLGSAMVQYDPHIDWKLQQAKLKVEAEAEAEAEAETDLDVETEAVADTDDLQDTKVTGRGRDKIGFTKDDRESLLAEVAKSNAKSNDDLDLSEESVEPPRTKKANAESKNKAKNKNKKSKSKSRSKAKQKELTPVPSEELQEYEHSPPSVVEAAESFSSNDSASGRNHPLFSSHPEAHIPSNVPHPQPLFIHTNYPKFNPRTIFTEKVNGAQTPTRDSNGTLTRCWDLSPAVARHKFGYDVERRLWSMVWRVACEDLIGIVGTGKGIDDKKTCDDVQGYIGAVYGFLELVPSGVGWTGYGSGNVGGDGDGDDDGIFNGKHKGKSEKDDRTKKGV